MPKATAERTTPAPDGATSIILPRAYELAMMLPALRTAHAELDIAQLKAPDKSEAYHRAGRKMSAVGSQIEALERLTLEVPAIDLTDAAAQLAILAPMLRDDGADPDFRELAARAVTGVLVAVANVAGIDLSSLRRASGSFDLELVK